MTFLSINDARFMEMAYKKRRPCEYEDIRGSKNVFTVVYTPHFLDRMDERSARGEKNILECIDFDDLFNKAENNQCYALQVPGNMFIYMRRAWHKKRKRWEFELISLTPDNHLQTRNRNFAKPFPL